MKKRFLASSALVAAGALAASPASAGIELGISGYMNTYFSVASIDEYAGSPEDFNPTGLFSDGEVHFSGEFTADNGITFGAQVELEMFGLANSFGDTIDERYIWVNTSFGQFYAGSQNTAAYQMHYAAPYAGLPINSGWATVFVPVPYAAGFDSAFEHPILSTYIDFGGDDNNVTYYTPRIYGFQLGLSYVPSLTMNGDGKNYPVEADTETEYSNGFSAGLNFVEDFNGFGVAVSGGWRWAQASDAVEALGASDYAALSFGAQFSYAGFTVGGSYANEYDGLYTDFGGGYVVSTEGEAWDVGATYGIGPWSFGVTYFHGAHEGDVATPGEDEFQAVQGGVYYALGPGIDVNAGVMWVEYDTEDGFEQSGIAGAVGLTFSF